ncbi:MAG: adenylate kinase [Ottowia sp.]|nr:adenylate kinase [Ottowia sp.]
MNWSKAAMVILITGASHTGKTLLAQQLLEQYKYPYFCIDHLKMGLIRSGQTRLTPLDDDALTLYLWPIVREMLKTAIENRQHLIVEGGYIPFDWRQDFDEEYLRAIRFICLAFTDRYIDTHFAEIRQHACAIESRLDDAGCTIAKLKADNKVCREGFQAAGERVTLIDDDYAQAVEALMSVGIETSPAQEAGDEAH